MNTNTTPVGDLAPLIGIEELAEYLDLPIKTLYKWRQDGTGPASVRVGRHVRYFVSDVQDWLLEHRTSSEAEPGRGVDSSVATTTSSTCSTGTCGGRPGRGSSQSPSRRCSTNRPRHLPTVTAAHPNWAATLLLSELSAQASTILDRNASA